MPNYAAHHGVNCYLKAPMLTVPMYAIIGHLDLASPEAHSITPPEPLSAESGRGQARAAPTRQTALR